MSRFLITVFLLLSFGAARAQMHEADSLKRLLAVEKRDTSRVLLLAELASAYSDFKPDTAGLVAEQGLLLARKIGFERGEVKCLAWLGAALTSTGNFPKALESCLDGLKMAEHMHDKSAVMLCENMIGMLYSEQGDYRRSLAYYYKIKATARGAEFGSDRLLALTNLGDCYERLNQLDSARIYTQQAYEMARKRGDGGVEATTVNNLGNIHSKMKQPAIAMAYYRLALPGFAASGEYDGICEAALGMARLFRAAGHPDSALLYAQRALTTARLSGLPRSLLDASAFLAAQHQAQHRPDSAYYYLQLAVAAKDSIFSQQKSRQVQALGFEEQLRQQELAAARQEAAAKRREDLQMAGIGAFIPVFFGLLILLSRRRLRPKTVESLGLVGVLLLFEFIALTLHPYIEKWTHHTPVLMILVLVSIAAVLVPMHHRLEHWVKAKLTHTGHPAT